MNRKGDVASILIAIVFIFIIGILFLFANRLNGQIYDKFDSYLENNPEYVNSTAHESIGKIGTVEDQVWDYAFLAIFFGFILALAFTAYSTRISPIFYWIYGVLSFIAVLLAAILSNLWQQAAAQAEFTDTISHFPITNMILGTYFPTVALVLCVVVMILLFGKPTQGGP